MLVLSLSLAFVLGGEPVAFDANLIPRFTPSQIEHSRAATRDGMILWAMTAQGRRLIEHFRAPEYRIVVIESDDESGAGRAPQPSLATLMAAGVASKTKTYELILNPSDYRRPRDVTEIAGPRTAAEVMAAAWAGEMLHIYYYSQGISLPHHNREDFQERWREVAEELGWPEMRHAVVGRGR